MPYVPYAFYAIKKALAPHRPALYALCENALCALCDKKKQMPPLARGAWLLIDDME